MKYKKYQKIFINISFNSILYHTHTHIHTHTHFIFYILYLKNENIHKKYMKYKCVRYVLHKTI